MKKKHRNITVGDTTYGWTVYGGGKEHTISIWLDKKVIHNESVRCQITPSLVKDIIVKNILNEKEA